MDFIYIIDTYQEEFININYLPVKYLCGNAKNGQRFIRMGLLQGRGKSGARVQNAPSILGNLQQAVEYEKKNDN